MNILAWNYRGTGSYGSANLLKELCRDYAANLIFLMETHACEEQALRVIRKTGMDGWYSIASQGQAGGIWCTL